MHVEAFTSRTRFRERRVVVPGGNPQACRPGDELELRYAAQRPDLAGLAREDVAQTVYGHLNPSDTEKLRPYHRAFPSLSMGDVVSRRPDDGSEGWSLSVEWEGFAPVSPPVFASEAQRIAYRLTVGGYATPCPWCCREVWVEERDEHVYVEEHRPPKGAFLLEPREPCGGSGEVYIDVWEEARAEARLLEDEDAGGERPPG